MMDKKPKSLGPNKETFLKMTEENKWLTVAALGILCDAQKIKILRLKSEIEKLKKSK